MIMLGQAIGPYLIPMVGVIALTAWHRGKKQEDLVKIHLVFIFFIILSIFWFGLARIFEFSTNRDVGTSLFAISLVLLPLGVFGSIRISKKITKRLAGAYYFFIFATIIHGILLFVGLVATIAIYRAFIMATPCYQSSLCGPPQSSYFFLIRGP